MREILTAEEMKYCDNDTIQRIGIPSLLLMERAALSVVDVLSDKIKPGVRVLIFAGVGNNGGDALAVGRLLWEKGASVFFCMLGDLSKVSKETKKQMEILQNLGLSIHDNFPRKEYDIMSVKEKQATAEQAFAFLTPLTSKQPAEAGNEVRKHEFASLQTPQNSEEKQAAAEAGNEVRKHEFASLQTPQNTEEKQVPAEAGYNIVIDGLFGIGLSRPITGIYEEAVRQINDYKQKGAFVAAIDIPSGICADTGRVLGCAVQADLTVTFAYGKAGHYFYPGREYTGELFVRPIGIGREAFAAMTPSYQTIEEGELSAYLPKRNPAGNKGTFGKVLLFAGSLDMCGAAILCGSAVMRTGAGMVKIITHRENRVLLQKVLPEAMLLTYETVPDKEKLQEAIGWADVLVAGPGIGKGKAAEEILHLLLLQGHKPFVMDADALNLVSEKASLQEAVCVYRKNTIVMTPHPGELLRLLGKSMEQYKESPYHAVKELSDKFGCILVGKDAVTLVAEPEQKTVYMNLTGNDGMATAGSGDVLAGVIGGLLAQGLDGADAARAGVCLHGRAGDRAAKAKSRYGMTASDMIEYLW